MQLRKLEGKKGNGMRSKKLFGLLNHSLQYILTLFLLLISSKHRYFDFCSIRCFFSLLHIYLFSFLRIFQVPNMPLINNSVVIRFFEAQITFSN